MSHPKKVEPVLFFIALMEREYNSFKRIKDILEKDLGMVLLQSQTFDFSKFTDYYIEEMGSPLWKTFYFFEYLKEPEFLVELKHICYSLERETADSDGKRNLNLDPGYLTLSKVVLATFKDYAHRIYLGRSVFAEVTLIYRSGGFQSLPWTYPDYKEKMTLEYFNRARALYKDRLRAH
jgi:hypothetical protein